MADDFRIAPPVALGVHVTDRLRRQIVSGELAPGTHLVEGRLSELFGVSRGPIRDALRQLGTEGLVEARRRGVFVLGLSVDDIDELYSLRLLVEREAVRLAMSFDDTDWGQAQRAVDAMNQAADSGDVESFARFDLDFHTAFYTLSRHRRLASIWSHYRPTFSAMLSVTNAQDARDLQPTSDDHVRLLAACAERDEETVTQLITEHIEGARKRMRKAHGRAVSANQGEDPRG